MASNGAHHRRAPHAGARGDVGHRATLSSLVQQRRCSVVCPRIGGFRLSGRVAPTDPLVLQRQTINPRTIYGDLPSDVVRQAFLDPARWLAYAGSATVARFLQMEGEEEIRAVGTANVRFIDKKELDRLMRQGPDSWVHFLKRFGSEVRLIRLSRIARTDEGTVALLYISYSCGPVCGKSHFVLFRRELGFWRVERIVLFSES